MLIVRVGCEIVKAPLGARYVAPKGAQSKPPVRIYKYLAPNGARIADRLRVRPAIIELAIITFQS